MGIPHALAYTHHAERRMRERGITQEQVERVVTDAHITIVRADGCTEFWGEAAGA